MDKYIGIKVRLLKQMYPMLRWVNVREVVEAKIVIGTFEFVEGFNCQWAATDEEGNRSGSFVATGLAHWQLPAFHTRKHWPWRGDKMEATFSSLLELFQEHSHSPRYIIHFEYDESHGLHVTVHDYSEFNWAAFHKGVYSQVVSELLEGMGQSLERTRAHLLLAAGTHGVGD